MMVTEVLNLQVNLTFTYLLLCWNCNPVFQVKIHERL